MTELPEWILVAKQRAEKWAKELPIPGLGDGNELMRSDVPRLIDTVTEMAKVLETVQDTCQDLAREDIHCVTEACCQFIDECETALTKYWRGESDD